MKTTNLSVNKENKEVNVTFALPFITPEHCIVDGETSPSDIIAANHTVLIKALEAHRNAYIENLIKYKDNIIFNDGTTIIYEMPDNETGDFSIPAYTVMSDAVHELKCGNYISFSLDKKMVREAIKALCAYCQSDVMVCGITNVDLTCALLDCLEYD